MYPHTTIAGFKDGEATMAVRLICAVCEKPKEVAVDPTQYLAWQAGTRIQDAMPDLPVETRELLISGTCNDCWQKMALEREVEE